MKKLTWKIWLLIIFVVLSLLSVFGLPPSFFQKGVLITSVEVNSTAFEQGLRQGQVIIEIDGEEISNLEDFSNIMQEKFIYNESAKIIITTKNSEIVLFTDHIPEITVSEIV